MKKILFPTDFSDNAANALNYAIEIINSMESAHLTILHTCTFPMNAGTFIALQGHLQSNVKLEMNRVVNRVQPLLREGVVLETKIEIGDTVLTIGKIADDYDLVIMGTQGATGLKEIFLGSITNAIIKNTKTPVLAIPKNYHFIPFNHIAFSLDNEGIVDPKGIKCLRLLLKLFDADLMLFHTEEEAADKGIDQEVIEFFDQAAYSIDFNFQRNSVNESIQEMVKDYDIDLLVMIQRKRGFLESIFHQSVTTKEVFHSSIPILIFHDL